MPPPHTPYFPPLCTLDRHLNLRMVSFLDAPLPQPSPYSYALESQSGAPFQASRAGSPHNVSFRLLSY